jgi:hypothetical protein
MKYNDPTQGSDFERNLAISGGLFFPPLSGAELPNACRQAPGATPRITEFLALCRVVDEIRL